MKHAYTFLFILFTIALGAFIYSEFKNVELSINNNAPDDLRDTAPHPSSSAAMTENLTSKTTDEKTKTTSWINPQGNTLETRILPPQNFKRDPVEKTSFAHYLRQIPMKKDGEVVRYYNGKEKPNHVHCAVIDIDVSPRDLQQCADAVMRLRAEYLFAQKRYNDISFNFTSGDPARYSEWMKGMRPKVAGNKVTWQKTANASNTYDSFRKYIDTVFIYAGTASLSKEMKKQKISNLQIGDVFIQGGFPGHAVIVMDVVVDATGKKRFLLAQSYMPAQDIHVLKNPNNEALSPWYELEGTSTFVTPEWTFSANDLKTW